MFTKFLAYLKNAYSFVKWESGEKGISPLWVLIVLHYRKSKNFPGLVVYKQLTYHAVSTQQLHSHLPY